MISPLEDNSCWSGLHLHGTPLNDPVLGAESSVDVLTHSRQNTRTEGESRPTEIERTAGGQKHYSGEMLQARRKSRSVFESVQRGNCVGSFGGSSFPLSFALFFIVPPLLPDHHSPLPRGIAVSVATLLVT